MYERAQIIEYFFLIFSRCPRGHQPGHIGEHLIFHECMFNLQTLNMWNSSEREEKYVGHIYQSGNCLIRNNVNANRHIWKVKYSPNG